MKKKNVHFIRTYGTSTGNVHLVKKMKAFFIDDHRFRKSRDFFFFRVDDENCDGKI